MSHPRKSILAGAVLAGVAWVVGCGDGTTDPARPPEIPVPATITVSPDSAELTAVGETVKLSAEVRDQHGRVMSRAAVTWVSVSNRVARVDAAGLVTAVGNGTSTITATAGTASGSAEMTVAQAVKGIEVLPAPGKVSAGDTLRLSAEAWDANGHTVPGGEFTWSSSDSAVAAVDESGLVHGIVEGVVTITATSAGVPGTAAVTVAHADWGPLAAFYAATQGQGWIEDDGWMSDRPIGEWHGVTTGPDGHVTALELASSHLTGSIPADLGRLSHLETLHLHWNRLRGPIPGELTRLLNLRSLRLDVNGLVGEIPAELANLARLQDLRLNHNFLSGQIPPQLGSLPNLTRLSIQGNDLTGLVPSAFTRFERLRFFHFRDNEYPCIPDETDFIRWLQRLDVALGPVCNEDDRKALVSLYEGTGGSEWTRSDGWLDDAPVSEWHGVTTDSLGRVLALDLADNGLAGALPELLAPLRRMTSLRLDGNEGLTGPLPLTLSALSLEALEYRNTGLCIPTGESFAGWLAAIPLHEGTDADCSPPSDREILKLLHSAVGGPEWKDDGNWLSSHPLGVWTGVETDAAGRVIALRLPRNDMAGRIPPQLGYLDQLRELDLSGNRLEGPIPAQLGNLSSLTLLNLGQNELEGPIPPRLGDLSNLSQLLLWANELEGPIPPELGRLTSLLVLALGINRLEGPIPPQLGGLANLYFLYLDGDRLEGPIPSQLGNLARLHELILNRNRLTGSIPSWLGSLPTLTRVGLGENWLTGSIPPELGNLPHLSELVLGRNLLTGSIPVRLASLSALAKLDLSRNRLTGNIPSRLGALSSLERLNLSTNELEGRIPAELGKLRNLRALILGVNDLSGSIPAEIGDLASLEVLRLRRNDLTGTVPPELGKLRNLTRLGLDWNDLVGPIPLDLMGLERLRVFHFPGNESLCAPGSTDFATWLSQLDVHVGPLCNEADRDVLAALHNATGGEGWKRSAGWLGDGLLEEWYGVGTDSLGHVSTLDLSNNDLAGRVPAVLAQLAGLTSLRIDANAGLTGPLPLSLSALPLKELRYQGTGLCVPRDDSFVEFVATIPSHEGTGEACAPLSDREVLEILYTATGGDDWENNENWLSDLPLEEWRGVTTDDEGRVVGVALPRNKLAGTIPPELGHLSNLSELDLSLNDLTGPIPGDLADLTSLSQLNLALNELSGPIPSELGNMPSLSWLLLGRNRLTGTIPPELGGLSSLTLIYLDNNRLTGPIPPELAGLSGLLTVNLSNNELSGPIPPELGTLPQMSWLRLSGNRLTGPIPLELGNLAALVELYLQDNELTGRIPPGLGSLLLLEDLILHDNELTGPIPADLGAAPSLSALTLGRNRLTGPIPPELGNLSGLEYLSLTGNRLTGPLPPELGRLSSMRTLHLDGNALSGPIPAEFGNLSNMWTLYLDRNELTGAIPPELGNLSRLQTLSAMENRLAAPLPTELGGMTSLRRLHLTGNAALSGVLPSGMTTLARLDELLVGGTGLCSPADTTFGDWISGVTVARVRPCEAAAVSSAYLTQAVQSRDVPVPLVAGRQAMLRVFPTASRPTEERIPTVRATFFVDGAETHVVEIPSSNVHIPTEVEYAESALERSANAIIPASVIRPGLEMVVEIDPDNTLDPGLGVTARIPEAGRAAMLVRDVPALDLTLVPFQWMRDRDSLIAGVANAMAADPHNHEMLADTRAMLPVGELDVKAHEPVLTSTNNTIELLIETNLIKRMEGGGGYYMGIMPERIVGGQSGVAYLGYGAGFSAADGFVIAHELGHNFALYHAPCGGAGGPDRAFPQSNGSIGNWGYDFRDGGALVSPHARDLMSYCGPPRWVSDYSFARALGYRLAVENSTGASTAGAPTRSILLWGGVDAHGNPFLEPAFVADAPPSAPRITGDYELTGRAATGEELFSLNFDMLEMADTDGWWSFVLALPLRDEWAGALESITLSGPVGSTTMDGTTDRPMAILLDPGSRQVRAILRGEDATDLSEVAADAAGPIAAPPRVIFSRGIPDAVARRR